MILARKTPIWAGPVRWIGLVPESDGGGGSPTAGGSLGPASGKYPVPNSEVAMETRAIGKLELREGNILAGLALPYGVHSPSFRERFEPGSVSLSERGVSLNLSHSSERVVAFTGGGGLDIDLREDGVYVEARLNTANPAATKARELIQAGHNGLSVEFNATRESRDAANVRVVEAAVLHAIGLVGDPAYPTRAEVRENARGVYLWL